MERAQPDHLSMLCCSPHRVVGEEIAKTGLGRREGWVKEPVVFSYCSALTSIGGLFAVL